LTVEGWLGLGRAIRGQGRGVRALWLRWSDEPVALGLWSLPKPSLLLLLLLLLRFAVLFVPDAIVPAPGGHGICRHVYTK